MTLNCLIRFLGSNSFLSCAIHFSSGKGVRRKSNITLTDCFTAARKLFSIVRLLLPFGTLISQSRPSIRMSGVFVPRVRFGTINSTSTPVPVNTVAVSSSCFSGSAPNGMMIVPVCLLAFIGSIIPPQDAKVVSE